ncbi:hypothetical protein IMCC1933_10030 [Rhodobacteraceae bacterium IMCC1933]|nr:hypothetical protein [Rhodobacteraceae bacterium IMCC1923]MDP4067461.1 hypothetical protein [Rhodobacteraceae bacterium IMCC1933]MDP4070662.1 hypothetical protein [Rhodobacteraceae bacterium IMCC1909]
MQLPIDTVIQPKFTQHRLQRALYSLWQARCRDGQIPLWQSLPCQALGPYLSAACVTGLAASNRIVIRIASTQANQLLGQDSRGQTLDSLCAPAIQPQFEHLVSQVFTRQSPMSVTLRSRAFDRESVLTMLPLLDPQGQCRRALAAVDLVHGQYRCEEQQKAAPFQRWDQYIMPRALATARKRLTRLCFAWDAKRAHRSLRAPILNWSVDPKYSEILNGQPRRAGFVGLTQLFSDQKGQFQRL